VKEVLGSVRPRVSLSRKPLGLALMSLTGTGLRCIGDLATVVIVNMQVGPICSEDLHWSCIRKKKYCL